MEQISSAQWRSIVGVVVLCAYAWFLADRYSAIAAGADSSGYANSARLLAAGKLDTPLRTVAELSDESPHDFTPLGFKPGSPKKLVPTYPVGLPLHLAALGLIVEWPLALLVVGIAGALGAVALTYAIARRLGVSRPLASIASGSLAVSPLFLFTSTQPLSDTLGTTWCLAAIYGAIRAREAPGVWSIGAGTALGIAVLVRPSNLLLLPALALMHRNWKSILGILSGGVPWAVFLAFYQNTLYGSATESGYGNIFDLFDPKYVAPTMVHFGLWLVILVPLVLLAPISVLWRGGDWRIVMAFWAWAASFIVFYAFYTVSHEEWHCLRFILPAIPALLILGALGAQSFFGRVSATNWNPVVRTVLVVGLAAGIGVNARNWVKRLSLYEFKLGERMYADAALWAEKNLPSDAIVCCMAFSGALYFYTNLPILRWDSVSTEDAARYLRKIQENKRPLYALLHVTELQDRRIRNFTGKWVKMATFDETGLWRIAQAEITTAGNEVSTCNRDRQ